MSEMNLAAIGKAMLWLGGLLIFGGLVALLLNKLNLPLGRLPGDIKIEGERGTFYFPLATSIILSILLTILLNLIGKLFK